MARASNRVPAGWHLGLPPAFEWHIAWDRCRAA